MSDEILSQAEFSLKNSDPSGAERLLNQQWPDISRAPGDAQHAMAMVRMAQGRGDEAERLIRAAIQAEPNSLRHHIGLGHILTEVGNHAGALEAYTSASKIDPKWPGISVALSQAFFSLERFNDAERAARQGIANAPSSGAYEALSNALRAQGKGQDALTAAEEALRADWQDPNAQHARAAALMQLNRPQEALAIFDELVQRGIDLPILHFNRAAALEALGRKADARNLYEDVARRWPNLPNLMASVAAARKRL
ncbi:MAG: tetratricopeptide repeat protein [Hyphomonadaceae bacterium]|nr:tetratricopeptide repeat protein [Hyphomonadaceae bacterium]